MMQCFTTCSTLSKSETEENSKINVSNFGFGHIQSVAMCFIPSHNFKIIIVNITYFQETVWFDMNHIRYSLSFDLLPGTASDAACSYSCLRNLKSHYTHHLRYPEIHSPVSSDRATTHNKNNIK